MQFLRKTSASREMFVSGICCFSAKRTKASSIRTLTSQPRNALSYSKRGAWAEAECQQFSTAFFACSGSPRIRQAMMCRIRLLRQNLARNIVGSSRSVFATALICNFSFVEKTHSKGYLFQGHDVKVCSENGRTLTVTGIISVKESYIGLARD